MPSATVQTTVDHYDPNNKKISEAVTTTHANGLYTQTQTDLNGDGAFELDPYPTLHGLSIKTALRPKNFVLGRRDHYQHDRGHNQRQRTSITTQKYIDGDVVTALWSRPFKPNHLQSRRFRKQDRDG